MFVLSLSFLDKYNCSFVQGLVVGAMVARPGPISQSKKTSGVHQVWPLHLVQFAFPTRGPLHSPVVPPPVDACNPVSLFLITHVQSIPVLRNLRCPFSSCTGLEVIAYMGVSKWPDVMDGSSTESNVSFWCKAQQCRRVERVDWDLCFSSGGCKDTCCWQDSLETLCILVLTLTTLGSTWWILKVCLA